MADPGRQHNGEAVAALSAYGPLHNSGFKLGTVNRASRVGGETMGPKGEPPTAFFLSQCNLQL